MQLKSLFLMPAAVLLVSCDSKPVPTSSPVVLDSPFVNRQVLNLGSNPLRIEVVVNGGQIQNFVLGSGQQATTVALTGIRAGESNTINIKWLEILNGFDVEISEQSDSFIASGSVVIDAMHVFSPFDYDQDGVSNFNERMDGSCVWSDTESCLTSGLADVPGNGEVVEAVGNNGSVNTPVMPTAIVDDSGNGLTAVEALSNTTIPQPTFSFDFSNSTDLAINGDFSNGTTSWSTQGTSAALTPNLVGNGNDLCGTLPPDSLQVFAVLYFYDLYLDLLPNQRYAFEFDIRSDRESVLSFTLTSGDGTAFIDQKLSVDQTFRTISLTYEHTREIVPRVAIAYSAIHHPIVATTYCIDNFRIHMER